MMRYR